MTGIAATVRRFPFVWLALMGVPLLFVLTDRYAVWRVRHEPAQWARDGLSPSLGKLFPRTEESESLRSLDRLAARAGIATLVQAYRPYAVNKKDEEELNAIIAYATALAEVRDDGQAPAAAPAVADYLTRHAADLDAIEALLSAVPALVSAHDIDPHGTPTPPRLVGARQLVCVLIARAMAAQARSDAAGAARAIGATWMYSADFDRRGELISQLVSANLGRLRNGAVRTLSDSPPTWCHLLSPSGLRERLLYSFEESSRRSLADTTTWQGLDLWREITTHDNALRRIPLWLWAPYLRLGAAGASEVTRQAVRDLHGHDFCAADPATLRRSFGANAPWWNRDARQAADSVVAAWTATRDSALNIELTRLVLQARARRRDTGDWGPPLAMRSEACPSLSWISERQEDRLSIRLAVDLGDPAPARAPRPWPFVLSPPHSRSRAGSTGR